ncbi:hypothetical protein CDD83_3619 [Cordyceps sp. RAO-2017]|nr:hypothetical protein CDD83_3619 [Cordyceps sp. RAO-2017]
MATLSKAAGRAAGWLRERLGTAPRGDTAPLLHDVDEHGFQNIPLGPGFESGKEERGRVWIPSPLRWE